MTIYSLDLHLSQFGTSLLFHVWFHVASWPAYRFLRRQVRRSDSLISWRIFHRFLWSTQSKALVYSIKQMFFWNSIDFLLVVKKIMQYNFLKIWISVSVICIVLIVTPFLSDIQCSLWHLSLHVYMGSYLSGSAVRTVHGKTDWFKIEKGVWQGCILVFCLFNLYAEYIMRNAGLEEA